MATMTLEEAATRRQVTGERFRADGLDGFSIFETDFTECSFVDCMFDGGKVGMSKFRNCHFTDCSFRDTTLLSCQFNEGGDDEYCVWKACDFSDAFLSECDLSKNRFIKCRGFMLRLKDCNLSETEVDLEVHRSTNARHIIGGISCYRTRFLEANFTGQDLEGSTFEFCDVRGANFNKCNLTSVKFVGSNLNGASIRNASLVCTNLAHSEIEELDLTQADELSDLMISAEQRDYVLKCFRVTVLNP